MQVNNTDDYSAGVSPRQPATAAPTMQLAQLHPADPTKGLGEYYGAYSNQGDLVAGFNAGDGQTVRLVDPHTGEVVASGVGSSGAQQIATLANAISNDLGKQANWDIQVEQSPGSGSFSTLQGDRTDNPHANNLKDLVRIAAPLLGAAIPGLAPFIGAALGGFGGTLLTGGNLKESLLSGATSALGNVAGGALSGALRGVPVSFMGSNPLGGVLGHASDALSGAGAAAGGAAGGSAADLASLLASGASFGYGGQTAAQLLASGALSGLTSGAGGAFNTVAPLTVTAAGPGALGTAAGLVGTGLGAGAGLTGSSSGGDQGNTVAPVTVTGAAPNGGLPIPGAIDAGTGGGGATSGSPSPQGRPDWQNQLLDLTGQTVGGVGGDLGIYGLAQLFGLMPHGPPVGGAPDGAQGLPAGGYDGSPDTGPVPGAPSPSGGGGGGGGLGVPTGGLPGATFGGGGGGAKPVGSSLGDSGGALAMALANAGTSGGTGAPLAAAPSLDVQGSTAPDIYPWRKRVM